MVRSPAARVPLSTVVRERLVELRDLAADLLPPDAVGDLDDAISRLGEASCNVTVVGEFKRGKSTLVNALVGHALLPTDVLPLTRAITFVRHGERPRVLVRDRNGIEEERPLRDLRRLVADPAATTDAASVIVEIPDELLARGVRIVDTPGTASTSIDSTATTEAFLGRIDVAVLVLAADQPLSAAERELTASLLERGRRVLFAVNKLDQIDANDRPKMLAFVADGLREITGRDAEIIALSARTGEGVVDLRARLAALADSDLADVLVPSTGVLGASLATSAARSARLQAAALRLPVDELETRARRLEDRLQALEQAHDDARDLLHRGVEKALASEVDQPLVRYAGDHRPSLEQELSSAAEAVGPRPPRELANELDAWIDDHIRQEFHALVPRYVRRISQDLQVLENRHVARIVEILDEVRASAQSALDTDLSTMPAAIGLHRPPAFTYKLDDPDDVLDRVIGAGRGLLPGALGRRLVMRSARERLVAMTDRHAGRLRSTLTERVREATQDYADELETTVEQACAAIRMAIAKARDSHAGAHDLAEARLRDLATGEEKCRALAAELSSVSGDA
jgi:small GTP-binding protein